MYICICNALNDRAISAAIEGGARSAAEVYRANGCRPRCGSCVCDVRQMLRTTREAAEPEALLA